MEKSRKAVFAGLARNVAPFLPNVLRNIELLSWAMSVCANGRCVNLIAMADHMLDKYRSRYPLYDDMRTLVCRRL